MADDKLRALGEERVRDFLKLARVARLATSDHSRVPHNIPICFWFDDVRESRNAQPARSLGQVEGIDTTNALELRLLLKDPNPETALSVLDLYALSHHGSFPAAFREERRSQVVSRALSDTRIPTGWFVGLGDLNRACAFRQTR